MKKIIYILFICTINAYGSMSYTNCSNAAGDISIHTYRELFPSFITVMTEILPQKVYQTFYLDEIKFSEKVLYTIPADTKNKIYSSEKIIETKVSEITIEKFDGSPLPNSYYSKSLHDGALVDYFICETRE